MNTEILVKTDISFQNDLQVLNYLADFLIEHQFVSQDYRQQIIEREKNFPTGIPLEKYAVAIPHCEAKYSLKPAIYFIRPNQKVKFNRADEEGTIEVDLIIALVVTDPQQQLTLLRTLFRQLQHSDFVQTLLTLDKQQLMQFLSQHFS